MAKMRRNVWGGKVYNSSKKGINWVGKSDGGNTVVLGGFGKKGQGVSYSKMYGVVKNSKSKKNGKRFISTTITKVVSNRKQANVSSAFGVVGKPVKTSRTPKGSVVMEFKRKGKKLTAFITKPYNTSYGQKRKVILKSVKVGN